MSEQKSPVNVDSEKAHLPPHPDATPQTENGTHHDLDDSLTALGYTPELHRNRSLFTLLFQTLAIAAIPYGEGGPLISAIYGGGQLSIFVGWLVVLVLDECVALSLSELASRYPTSAGPYYVRTMASFSYIPPSHHISHILFLKQELVLPHLSKHSGIENH